MDNKGEIVIYQTQDGTTQLDVRLDGETVWMNQNQLAELFDTSKQGIGQHIANMLNERELDANSVVKDYLTTAVDGRGIRIVA